MPLFHSENLESWMAGDEGNLHVVCSIPPMLHIHPMILTNPLLQHGLAETMILAIIFLINRHRTGTSINALINLCTLNSA